MADRSGIRAGMQVLGADGGMVGRVTGLHGDHIHVQPDAPEPEGDRLVPNRWVARVDEHVHLDRDAALVRDTWGTHESAAAASTASIHHEAAHSGVGKSWIVWIIGAILLLVIIVIGIRGCAYGVDDPDYQDSAGSELRGADRAVVTDVSEAAPVGLDSDVGRYLASDEPAPRSFALETLRFEANAGIGDQNRDDLAILGRVLAAHPDARIQVTSGVDGTIAEDLAERRAEAVAAALIANGVRPANVETAIGGAGNQLVILSR